MQQKKVSVYGKVKTDLGLFRRLKGFSSMIILGVCCFSFQGCVTQTQAMLADLKKAEISIGLASCVELTTTQVLMELASPTAKMSVDNGEVWIFKYQNAESSTTSTGQGAGTWLSPYEVQERTVQKTYELEVKLLFDKTNKAQQWSYNGLCPLSFDTPFHRRGRQIMNGNTPASVQNWGGVIEQFPSYRRGLLSVAVQENTAGGVITGDIAPNTPAQKAGLIKGDNIMNVNGEAIKNVAHFIFLIGRNPPGTKVGLRLKRDGQLIDLVATLGRMPQ